MIYASGTIEAVDASGPGALAGWEFRCRRCPEVATFTRRDMTESHADGHAAYMRHEEG